MHKLNSIVPFAYARFTILIILLLPHHRQCIASVYFISICRGGPFSTADYGICWTPSLAPCSSMNKLLCSPPPAPPCCTCEGYFPQPCMAFFWIPQVWPACSSMNQPWCFPLSSHSAFHSPAIVFTTLRHHISDLMRSTFNHHYSILLNSTSWSSCASMNQP